MLHEKEQPPPPKKTLHHDESNTITHKEVLGGLTENDGANIKHSVDKWKAGERLTRGGDCGGGWFVGWGEKEGQAVIDCTACVVTMRRRRTASGCGEKGRLGFAPRAAVKAWCPSPENAPTSLQWAVPWSH